MQALKAVQHADEVVSGTRSSWAWLGQAALAVLGIHLACDSLDDHVLTLLQALPIQLWEDPNAAALPAAWVAVALELTLAAWVVVRLWHALTTAPATWDSWKSRLAVRDVTRVLFWVPVALAGAWVIGMAVEDLVAPLHPWLGAGLGWATAALTAWRLGFTGLRAIVGGPPAKKRWHGIFLAPVLLGVAGLALGELPIWGWWP